MFCPKCGTELDDSADFCYSCGERIPNAPGSSAENYEDLETLKKKLRCPSCGSTNFQPITETYGETKGYDCCNGLIGYLLLGPVGWLCGACGMGKGKTTTTTCFICKDCGTKFR
jgi:DNA-directed RNA polymerase subunit RPC12/RpoP